MKKYLLTVLILAFTAQINAQNNLVFNQVLCFELALNTTVTVPEGKVWKVEFSPILLVADKQDVDYGLGLNNAIVQGTTSRNAIWFPEGTSIRANGNQGVLSILEFNVVAVSSGSGGGSGNTNSTNDFSTPGGGQSYGDDYTPGESVTDNDGNVYGTVTIGPQTWTTSNLDVSTYRDGTPIPHITDFNEWKNATTGAYTYINQNESEARGKVYNVWAVIGRNDEDPNTALKELAPEGFRIPSFNDWRSLIDFFGGFGANGVITPAIDFLKSETGWYLERNGNNESGLNIYPTGNITGTTSDVTGSCFSNCSDGDLLGSTEFHSSTRSGSGASVTILTIEIGNQGDNLNYGSVSSFSGVYSDGTLYSNGNGGAFIRLIKN